MDEQADLNLHWAHMSEGAFSDVAAHIPIKETVLKHLNSSFM